MRRYYKLATVTKFHDYATYDQEVRLEVFDLAEADLVSSETRMHGARKLPRMPQTHQPVFDLDFAAELLPSSTPGHFHLYLNREISWRKYKKVLKAMMKAGLIEPGWYKMTVERHAGHLRAPALVKEESPRTDTEVVEAVEKLQVLEEELGEDVALDERADHAFWESVRRRREEDERREELAVRVPAPAFTGYGGTVSSNRRVQRLSPY